VVRKITFLALFVFTASVVFAQSCLTGGISLKRQGQLDSFPTFYPGCKNINGSVILDATAITDLSKLIQIKKIKGNLTIHNNNGVIAFKGLDSLAVVSGDLSIFNNSNLTSFTGLARLDSIYGSLDVRSNNSLSFGLGISNIKYIGNNINFIGNTKLTVIDLFSNVTSIKGDVAFSQNDSTAVLKSLNNLKTIGGKLIIDNNKKLASFQFLENLEAIKGSMQYSKNASTKLFKSKVKSILGDLTITEDTKLTSLDGLENLKRIKGNLDIGGNPSLATLNLTALDSVTGFLSLYNHKVLADLGGMSNLKYVGQNFSLYFNAALKNINGLSRVKTIAGTLSMTGNSLLQNLIGLDSIDINKLSKVEIFLNPKLSVCNVPKICAYLELCKPSYIYKNSGNCEYLSSIEKACGLPLKSREVTILGCDSIVVKGNTYRSTGFFQQNIKSITGCDTSLYLNLTVNKSQTIKYTYSSCDSFVFKDKKFYVSGVFNNKLKSKEGCDSIEQINYTVKKSAPATITVSACESYSFNNVSFTKSGTYLAKIKSKNGCDSIVTINLTIKAAKNKRDTIYRVGCDSVKVNNSIYRQNGKFEQSLITKAGCDSMLTIFITIKKSTSQTIKVEKCERYTANNITYTSSGIYKQKLVNKAGCDSLLTIDLKIKLGKNDEYSYADIGCGKYEFNGKTLTESGRYQAIYLNKSGCDSIINLELIIRNNSTATIAASACEFYTLNSRTYNTTGKYVQSLFNKGGCDSILTLDLTIKPGNNTTATKTDTTCGSYTYLGTTYTQSGTYTKRILNKAGCDSIITLKLLIHPTYKREVALVGCDSFVVNKIVYKTNGNYTQTFFTNKGCDSTVLYLVRLKQSSSYNMKIAACVSTTVNEKEYNKTGIYKQVLKNKAGCDSTINIDFTLLPGKNVLNVFNVTSCNEYNLNGQSYTKDGRYFQYLKAKTGCDSTIIFDLTILKPTLGSITAVTCDKVTVNGIVYDKGGEYTQKLINKKGCDSILTVVISKPEISTNVVFTKEGLLAVNAGKIYQWVDCATNTNIPGATGQKYLPTKPGSYAVRLSQGSCSELSACITATSTKEVLDYKFAVRPNPTSGDITIEIDHHVSNVDVYITNIAGSKSQLAKNISGNEFRFNLGNFAAGIYTLELIDQGKVGYSRVVVVR
jgi:riboflavin synthase